MKPKKRIISVILLIFISWSGSAQIVERDIKERVGTGFQRTDLHFSLGGGFAVGGTAPIPMPRSIRQIRSYNPQINLHAEGYLYRRLVGSWGVQTGLRVERKGMKTRSRVKDYRMEMTADDGAYMEGLWTGDVETRVGNVYLTLPVLATYAFHKRWQVQAGPYLSVLFYGGFSGAAYNGYLRHHDPTGEKVYVTHASYKFGPYVRRCAWGAQFGGAYLASTHLCLNANVDWGVSSIFHDSFSAVGFRLFPMYGRVGAAYMF